MALTERDVNTQRDLPRNKRHSVHQDLTYTRLKDENSPSPGLRGKFTKTAPLSQRLLAPTKSSAAKATTTSPRVAGPSTPQPRASSKLPRRTTPNTAPSMAGNDSSIASPEVLEAGLEFTTTDLPANSRSIDSQADVLRGSSLQELTQAVQPSEKPLPSRPCASLAHTLSPRKDSRTLMDASEKPLQQSVDGKLCDWTVMLPRSASGAALHASDVNMTEPLRSTPPFTASPENIFSPDRWIARVPNTLVNTSLAASGDGGTEFDASERSSSSTFLSADDGNVRRFTNSDSTPASNALGGHTAGVTQHSSDNSTDSKSHDDSPYRSDRQTEHPPRNASLKAQYGHGFVTAPNLEQEFPTLVLGKLRPVADSRPHSPSPASFSRPRPSSISYGRGLPSPNTTVTEAAKVLRAQKTASRIPLPDPKKAMLVDVKTRISAATQKSDCAPSFGSRRLDAPDTLRILDQGIKRRQMNQPKRTNTGRSTATTETSSTETYGHNEIPQVDRSKNNTPDGTLGTSSSEEEEIATPTYHVGFGDDAGVREKHTDGHSNSYYHTAAVRLFDGAVSALGRTPPPTSRYTDPLQTIPSQAILPTCNDDEASHPPTHSRVASDLKSLNKRLSDLHTAHADYTAARIGDRARVPESTKYSLLELLNEYTSQDSHYSKDGCSVLDAETKKHITRTLSMLEGNGSPPHTDVDNETLLRLFGHLKRGMERQPESVSFIDNAAAAEQFLAHANDGNMVVHDAAGKITGAHSTSPNREAKKSPTDAMPPLPLIEAVASKWSESTGSVEALSPVSSQVSPRHLQNLTRTNQLHGPPQRTPPDPPRSIGYPSRISSKASALIGPGEPGVAKPPVPFRRPTSPTLGKRQPGSVRAARDTLHHMKGGFARTTASAESKKSPKMPTPSTRPLQLPEISQRGRVVSSEHTRSQPEFPVVPKKRSRSKRRYVLDKLNGLFSTKREWRGSVMPPVPSIAELDTTPTLGPEITITGNTVLSFTRSPSGVKMPTMSPALNPPALPDVSRLDTPSSVDCPVDSVTGADDSNPEALQTWAFALISKAARERDPVRKVRLVAFAKVLNDSMISARETQISAETAQQAARSAQLSYEKTQESVAMLQRLAASLVVRGGRR
ncbi:hypothetical protein LTR91_013113 [Friedmanniomyces endolithicus]|uniref:Uncharacterized protein n=1 Tax=Friedmanniomyces endolithicus TaxID=329885 RepID=A0AAN6KEI8_9PEZI|nr:hypothetical protein LTR94_001961 [Friedmanniomyces endolithicus]KAK0802925.1 hypothetical protein LTR38_006366 [Friedmanniomyces endolithicus]KAK0811860.1 hypothetical protein LTR59_001798 [Friedmanniomyces endolithicus]KAK0857340.1 hypothetical protein LTR03_000830 [Friedmanniomyces endolithicus]KAK0873848.1 hypothetical protein LTS02_000637 [Friedmanniomyces endolithicus]